MGISYDARTYAEGKKIGLRDGFRALWCIWKYRKDTRTTVATPKVAPEVAVAHVAQER